MEIEQQKQQKAIIHNQKQMQNHLQGDEKERNNFKEIIEQDKSEEEWGKIRQQYFDTHQSIKQNKMIIQIVMKWVWIKHETQFTVYREILQKNQNQGWNSIQDLLKVVLQNQQQNDWKISKKYDLTQINNIIEKLKVACQKQIQTNKMRKNEVQIDKQQLHVDQNNNIIDQIKLQQANQMSTPKQNVKSQPFPKLNFRRKVLSQFINLEKQIQNNNQIQNSLNDQHIENYYTQNMSKKITKSDLYLNILTNPFLKKTFKYFCKQNYRGSTTFDIISQAEDKMNINKWMVFCKQFNFIGKFNKKQLMDIYRVCANFACTMNMQQFLHGVVILQEKYTQKYHTASDNFISQILQLSNEAAFRIKMANLKISYAGPNKNSFQQVNYTERARQEKKVLQIKYRQTRKQRQIVLIKGMFQDHMKIEIKDLKIKRQQKKLSNVNTYSYLQEKRSSMKSNSQLDANCKTRKHKQTLTYANIFRVRNSVNTARDQNKSTDFSIQLTPNIPNVSHKSIKCQDSSVFMNKTDVNVAANNYEQEIIQLTKNPQQQINKNDDGPRRKWLQPKINRQEIWITRIRSDSEESDEILKQHLKIQKKIGISQPTRLRKIKRESNSVYFQVQQIKAIIQSHDDLSDETLRIQTLN